MKILLMGMPDIGNGYPTQMLTTPNLGLSSIAANLDERHPVKIADLVLRRNDVKTAMNEALETAAPDLVGLSAMTFQYKTALKIAAHIKKHNPRIKIALGGYHATLLFEEIADSPDGELFDLLFRGESDLNFNDAVNALEEGMDLSEVDGLSFKRNGRFIHNKPRALEDLSHIKLPSRSARLWNDFNVLKVPWDLIEFSRGCLMACNFCNIRNMYGKSFRTYKTERVMKDIVQAKKEGIKILLFVDDNITMDIQLFESLCEAIIANGHNDLIYGVQASSKGIASSETLVAKMAEAGFKYVYLGIESPSKKNLAEWNKGDIVEYSKMSVKYLKKRGISVAGGFIIGSPHDDLEQVEATFKFARSLKTDFSAVQILMPYPKTKIRERLLRERLVVRPDDYEMYDGGHPVVRTHYLDENQLFQAKYRFGRKYLGVRAWEIFKTLLKQGKKSRPFLVGSLKLLPKAVDSLIFAGIKRHLISESKRFDRYWQGVITLNKFDIE
jgi:anaerobic magnesium-protoporphyrin IX monomethyl ester cyclase